MRFGLPGIWSRRVESNHYLALRRHSFYPLNYGETREKRQVPDSIQSVIIAEAMLRHERNVVATGTMRVSMRMGRVAAFSFIYFIDG